MQRDLWTRDDLRNTLVAAYYAGIVAPNGYSEADQQRYAEGFHSALVTLALSFGLTALPFLPKEPTRTGSVIQLAELRLER